MAIRKWGFRLMILIVGFRPASGMLKGGEFPAARPSRPILTSTKQRLSTAQIALGQSIGILITKPNRVETHLFEPSLCPFFPPPIKPPCSWNWS